MNTIALHWFRQDLRLCDNPALSQAASCGKVLPLYILDQHHPGSFAPGGASQWWLHHSLQSLNDSLGGKLSCYQGDPITILMELVSRWKIKTVTWNRLYEPWAIERDRQIKQQLLDCGVEVHSSNGSLLWEPWTIKKPDGTPYRVFTPFYRKGCLQAEAPRKPLAAPEAKYVHDSQSLNIDDLNLLPTVPWDQSLKQYWKIGEDAAHNRWQQFITTGLPHYRDGRNLPAQPFVSRLSPHLHFGEVSANQLWYSIHSLTEDPHTDHFCSELGWREFSYSQLYYHKDLPTQNLQSKFDQFPWSENSAHLQAWQQGLTGIPMVDAGMRELWQTGYMHNRVRMIVGSFLVKNLRIHWHHGERWFWDTLVDADLANNSASWQWIAGCGADAAPYFRIFNPVTQGQKFDPQGEYIRRWLPELQALALPHLFSPWQAPSTILKAANITLGQDYPWPIVDLQKSRSEALAAFQSLK